MMKKTPTKKTHKLAPEINTRKKTPIFKYLQKKHPEKNTNIVNLFYMNLLARSFVSF